MKYCNFYFVTLIILFSSCFNVFEKEQERLAKLNIGNNATAEAMLVTTGATTKDVVQVTFAKGGRSQLIGTFESYNWAELIILPNNTLLVKLSDSSNIANPIDTQYIKLPAWGD